MEEGGAVQVEQGREQGSHIIHRGDGYYYHVREVRGNRVRLKCRHRSIGCHGTASVNLTTGILWPLQAHTCQQDPLFIEDMHLRRTIVEQAGQNIFGAGIRTLLRESKLRCNNPALARRFTTSRMHSPMYRARSENYPRIPQSLFHLGVLIGQPDMQAVCRTVDGEDYIFKGIAGIVRDKTVSIIFASGRMLQFLQSRRNWHLDGTFRKRPRKPNCGQVYNIVTNYGSTVIAMVRVLMMRRTQAAYVSLFNCLRNLAPNLQPTRLHCDFERAQINALRQVFPGVTIAGCLWHYGVCCSSKAFKLGLAPLAAENDMVFNFIKALSAAPLLPAALISVGVEEIWIQVQASGWAQQVGPLFNYFCQKWLPRAEELSVFGMPERTNNCSESDNRMLENVLPQNRPNIWRLVGAFVQAEHLSWCDKLAIDTGGTVNGRRRWKAVANDNCVKRLSGLLISEEITPGHFLRAASYSIMAAVNHGLRLRDDRFDESDSDPTTDSESD